MRCYWMLLACPLTAWSVPSQSASIDRVDVLGYGIMTGTAGVPDGSSDGIEHREGGVSHVVQSTTKIPACLGVRFGFVFSAVGAQDGTPSQLTEVYKFPPSGLRKPGGLSPILESRFEHEIVPVIHRKAIYYEFDNSWELVPGQWTLELRDAERVLASKTFTVVASKKSGCRYLSA